MEHEFTLIIHKILAKDFGSLAEDILSKSQLIKYLNVKTVSAARGAKARSSFGNIYAMYVLIEDYVKKGFVKSGKYSDYKGAIFSDLFRRQRELPFGAKLQNHHLNHRLNEEFAKYFPTCEYKPIVRDTTTQRYWFNEHLLLLKFGRKKINIAPTILKIIDAYIEAKEGAFNEFIRDCERIAVLEEANTEEAVEFIKQKLQPNVDARIFEIISYALLKEYYGQQSIFWGWSPEEINEEALVLYKTGRCNANDGGIDFVMKPLGRFFQVTETFDLKKYFLDIDKVQKCPLTFVVKSEEAPEVVLKRMEEKAKQIYPISRIVSRYMEAIEEVINIPMLVRFFKEMVKKGKLKPIIREIVLQSKLEFNIDEESENGDEEGVP